ncbi:class I SAM-dependent methyltransferase [Dactylosporangium sp. NPDC051485]|uniref:class I SAM-dependent methyltransferase n=1 Tax=Dactylosporangium sp. NPDC051485 TaxID=3154846 RepID=UPI00342F3692
MKPVDYDGRQHTVYATGRALPGETTRTWAEAFSARAPAQRPLTVLDLGSGTGRFTPLLADTFGGPVYGVEPSSGMREQAAAHPAVRYLQGRGETVPLPDSTCDLALLFLSLHHFTDPPAAAAELRRVLRPGGRVLIRSTFSDRMPDLLWHRYFPSARGIEERTFPSLPATLDLFAAAGLEFVALDRIRELSAPSLAAYAERLRLRAISTFEHLSEAEIEQGLAALATDAAAEQVPHPVYLDSDLLTLALRRAEASCAG